MINFNDYFNDGYQYTLKELSYKNIENSTETHSFNLTITDTIKTNISNQWLNIVYGRQLMFEPEALYAINVEFEIHIPFKDEIDPNTIKVNWEKELIDTENSYISNIASRISLLISTITSSYGQQPVITPPLPMFENND